jgi:hypothetical protein
MESVDSSLMGSGTTPHNFLSAPSPLKSPYKKGMQIKNRNAINWSLVARKEIHAIN